MWKTMGLIIPEDSRGRDAPLDCHPEQLKILHGVYPERSRGVHSDRCRYSLFSSVFPITLDVGQYGEYIKIGEVVPNCRRYFYK